MTVRTVTCAQCGAVVPGVNGPVHKYVPSAPGCWQVFGHVQADEALRFGYPSAHRIVVDAYIAQHPGDGSDRRDRQSVFVHLAGLCAVLDMQIEPDRATDVLRRVLRGKLHAACGSPLLFCSATLDFAPQTVVAFAAQS
jgi:hypothetical protein